MNEKQNESNKENENENENENMYRYETYGSILLNISHMTMEKL